MDPYAPAGTTPLARAWHAYLAGSLGLAGYYVVVPQSDAAHAWLYTALVIGTLVAQLVGIRCYRPAGALVWWILVASQALIVAAGVSNLLLPVVAGMAAPDSLGTMLLVVAYVGYVIALSLLVHYRGEGGDSVDLLDTVIIAVGVGVLSWVFLIAPNVQGLTELADISVAYLLLDVLLLAMTVRLAIVARRRTPALWLLLAWSAGRLIADSGYALTVLNDGFHLGHPVFLGWMSAYAFVGAAALHPSMQDLASPQPGRDRGQRGRLVALGAAGLLAPGGLIAFGIEMGHGDVVISGLAVGLLVVLMLIRLARVIGVLGRAEARLSESQARLVEAQRIARVGSFDLDLDSNHITWSTEMYRIFGLEPGEPLAAHVLMQRVHPEDRHLAQAVLDTVANGPAPYELQVRILRTDGDVRTVLFRGEGRADATGRVVRLVGTIQDITERKQLEQELTHQALHDPLTGLANRTLLQDRVAHALVRAARTGERLTLLFIDLDDFKLVNDSLGHEAGDRLLVAVAERLHTAGRAADTVARLGGDEFAILLEGIGDRDAARIAERVLAALRPPVDLDGTKVSVHASIGIAHHDGGGDAGALLRNADLAMYAAKRNGKGRFQAFAPAMRAAVMERLELDAALRHAVDAQLFELHYQPIVTLSSRRVVGFEALLRWTHPDRGPLSPERFVPVLEESGLIVPVGDWVLREACARMAAWHEDTGRTLSMSVNVSPRQLQRADFVDRVAEALNSARLPASSLILEITEGVMVADTDQAVARLHAVTELGVRTAVDDFGTGYSSLRYLQILPVDSVKIDQSFIVGIEEAPERAALAQAIVKVARTLHLEVVAEGIETSQQANYLRAIGCHYGQGHHFAEPQDAASVEVNLRKWANLTAPQRR